MKEWLGAMKKQNKKQQWFHVKEVSEGGSYETLKAFFSKEEKETYCIQRSSTAVEMKEVPISKGLGLVFLFWVKELLITPLVLLKLVLAVVSCTCAMGCSVRDWVLSSKKKKTSKRG